jgi:hypothetical protein
MAGFWNLLPLVAAGIMKGPPFPRRVSFLLRFADQSFRLLFGWADALRRVILSEHPS